MAAIFLAIGAVASDDLPSNWHIGNGAASNSGHSMSRGRRSRTPAILQIFAGALKAWWERRTEPRRVTGLLHVVCDRASTVGRHWDCRSRLQHRCDDDVTLPIVVATMPARRCDEHNE